MNTEVEDIDSTKVDLATILMVLSARVSVLEDIVLKDISSDTLAEKLKEEISLFKEKK